MRWSIPVSARSVVSERGQTVIPKEIRDKVGMKPGTRLRWTVIDGKLTVSVLPDDPIGAMEGALKDLPFTTEDLLAERRAERDKGDAQLEEMLKRWRSGA
jgi:AbrB family looped-hinge helix DNA binding protein